MKEVWREIRSRWTSAVLSARSGIGGSGWLSCSGASGCCSLRAACPHCGGLAFAAMTEELAYRALLQRQLEQCVPGKWGLFTGGMLLTSALFALSHLPTHTPLMAALTFFPSARLRGPLGRATARSGSAPPSISGTTCFFFSLEPVHIPYMRIPARLRRRTR